MNADHEAFVYNRTKSKAQNLLDKGATWCDSVEELAQKAEIIFTILGYPKDVEETYLGEKGVVNSVKEGTILVDMTTSDPSLAEKIYQKGKSKGIQVLDAPVTGGDLGAKNATLTIFVGGEEEVYKKVKEFFELMGKTIAHMGSSGRGQYAKLANQIAIASNLAGTVETLLFAERAGLDLEKVIQTVGSGSASSWQFNNMGPRMLKGDFEPGFYIKHFVKDMALALDEAKKMKLALPSLALIHQFYQLAIAQGHEDLGTQALYKVLKEMNTTR
jgi:3-hydroxyisobutyrate dehydrogenase